jgi:hypothetical protein
LIKADESHCNIRTYRPHPLPSASHESVLSELGQMEREFRTIAYRLPRHRSWFTSGFPVGSGQSRRTLRNSGRSTTVIFVCSAILTNTGIVSSLARPNTLLIDSKQLESGEALDDDFRGAAALEIEQYKREIAQRSGAGEVGEFSDSELLREVMNRVGKKGRLGEQVRCVVSVAMLTEGWDTNTVTHILGVRAFGKSLVCAKGLLVQSARRCSAATA